VITALGDKFDFLAYYSDFRIDNQEAGTPSDGPKAGNVLGTGEGQHVLEAAGYGKYLNNRVGHSIGTEAHGNGANMDNFESRDERELLPNTCFSIEPGVYLPEFGLRSEINMLVRRGSAEITGRVQNHLELI